MFSFSGALNVVILLGALQGFIISTLLFVSRENHVANRRLGVLIFLMSLASLNIYLLEQGMPGWSPGFLIFAALTPMIIVMPMGPLIYFYIRSFSNSSAKLKQREWLHFTPVILDLLPYLIALFYIIGLIFAVINRNDVPWISVIDVLNTYSDIPRWISVTTYLLLSLKFLNDQKKILSLEAGNYSWLRQFVIVFLCFQWIWLLHLIPYILPQFRLQLMESVGWYPVYIPLAVLIYWLGIKGYIVSYGRSRKRNSIPLSPETIQSTLASLRDAMAKDWLFLDPALNLSRVASHVNVPQKIISAVLNQHFEKSFNEFVNEYRIEEFKRRVRETGHQHLTIAGIALECGFNSQPTFQRTFKYFTGMSPTEYLSQRTASKISA
jgi:AraC-like DNA-binding protein